MKNGKVSAIKEITLLFQELDFVRFLHLAKRREKKKEKAQSLLTRNMQILEKTKRKTDHTSMNLFAMLIKAISSTEYALKCYPQQWLFASP